MIAALLLTAVAYVAGAEKARIPIVARICFYVGWSLTALALVSPLCPLSVSLFAARVGQHMALTLIAAPLVALGQPCAALQSLVRQQLRSEAGAGAAKTAIVAAGLYAMLLWYWHTPVPYEFTFASPLVYWLMHLTLYGSALWLWSALLLRPGAHPAWTLAAGLVSTVQMGLLGALLTLAPAPLFPPHLFTTQAWGLTPLQDQQLGGALMWAPGGLVFLIAALSETAAVLAPRRPNVPLVAGAIRTRPA